MQCIRTGRFIRMPTQIFKESMNNKIIDLMQERLEIGYKRYGKTVDEIIGDGRDFEQEALEEILDCCVYILARILEIREKRK